MNERGVIPYETANIGRNMAIPERSRAEWKKRNVKAWSKESLAELDASLATVRKKKVARQKASMLDSLAKAELLLKKLDADKVIIGTGPRNRAARKRLSELTGGKF